MGQIQLRDLPAAILTGEAFQPVDRDETFWPEQTPEDLAAMKVVLQDCNKAEGFLVSRQYIRQWDSTDILFYAWVEPVKWPGTEVNRASLGMPLVAKHTFSLLSAVQQALFSGNKSFQVDPRPGTTLATAAARQALCTWELERTGFKQELRLIAYDALLYGTGVGFWGYEPVVRRKRKKVRKNVAPVLGEETGPRADTQRGGTSALMGDGDASPAVTQRAGASAPTTLETELEEEELVLPKFEYVNIRHYLVDPGCRRSDIRTAKWAARRMYLSADDLDQLRDVDGFQNIPTREEFERVTTPDKEPAEMNPLEMGSFNWTVNRSMKAWPRWMETTVDPLRKDFEVIEYWTRDRVIHVLEKQVVIRNATHHLGRLPFVSVPFYEAPDSYYGLGLGFLIGNFQRVQQGVVNLYLDDMSLNLNGMFVSARGMNDTMGQAIWASPGKVVKVDDVKGFKPIDRQPVGSDAMGMISACEGWAQATDGANEITVQGTMPAGRSSITRTAGGANLLASGSQTRQQDFVDQIADLVILPTIEAFIEMDFENLTPEQIKAILGEELGHAYHDDPIDILNGSYKLSVTAGSRLQARTALAAQLPTLITMITSPSTVQGLQTERKKIDYAKFTRMMFDSVGYPGYDDIVVNMTADDVKTMMAMNPAAQQAAVQQQKIAGEAAAAEQLEQDKVGGRALNIVLKHTLAQDASAFGSPG